MSEKISFEAFREEWDKDIRDGDPSTTELGNRFARKLVTQWLDIDESSDDIEYCDGSGDGGIDIACLKRGENESDENNENTEQGHTWYLVQSKYGKAFAGSEIVLNEGQKIIETLDGKRSNLSSITKDLLERLLYFKLQASEHDKLIVVFATEQPLNEKQKQTLEDIRTIGINRLGEIFDIETVSIFTIYQRLLKKQGIRIKITIKSHDARGDNLIVGSIKINNLYDFMKRYRDETGDLDLLYEKNVRRFLGMRRKVNIAMKKTLEEQPENFGLYNNGVTIVVEDFEKSSAYRGFLLIQPYIVNGCQTTKTIWEVLFSRLESGGTGSGDGIKEWKQKLEQGIVVIKIVKVGSENDEVLNKITRSTNSQNAVSEKDFIGLTSDFREWHKQIGIKYDLFLEIQRGGWSSREAFQKKNPTKRQFKEWANAFDLIKVYGAGWLGEAGLAFSTNQPFLLNGSIFKKIINNKEDGSVFGIDDLYAAYQLKKIGIEKYQFGRKGTPSRRITRFLFYMIVIELLKFVMIDAKVEINSFNITKILLKIFNFDNQLTCNALSDTAIQVIDEYMTQGQNESIYQEPDYLNKSKDIKTYMGWEQLGKSKYSSPKLLELLTDYKRTMKRNTGGQSSPFDLILQALTNS